MKRTACLIIICLCLFAYGCAPEATPAPTIAVTVSPAPVETPAPTPTPAVLPPVSAAPEKTALTPEALIGELWAKGEPSGNGARTTVWVEEADIAEILEAHGETELSARLREDEALWSGMYLDDALLSYTGSFADGGADIPFTAIFFNSHRTGFCLVMENRGEWRFGGYFECGEMDFLERTDSAVSTFAAQTTDKGLQTWLLVPGWISSGTGRACYDCVWYNLNTGRADIRYITRNLDIGGTALPYSITSAVRISEEFIPGTPAVTVNYSCRFGVAPGYDWDDESGDAITQEHAQYFYWEDGALRPEGIWTLYAEKDVLASTFIDVCFQQFIKLEEHGARKEKAWAKDVRQMANEEKAALITLTEQGGAEHVIGRYAGGAKAPRFDEFWKINPTIECAGGAPIALSFIETPDRGCTLTRYTEDGNSEAVPIDNGVFLAHKDAGTMLYTLEGEWFFGKYSYDFNVTVAP